MISCRKYPIEIHNSEACFSCLSRTTKSCKAFTSISLRSRSHLCKRSTFSVADRILEACLDMIWRPVGRYRSRRIYPPLDHCMRAAPTRHPPCLVPSNTVLLPAMMAARSKHLQGWRLRQDITSECEIIRDHNAWNQIVASALLQRSAPIDIWDISLALFFSNFEAISSPFVAHYTDWITWGKDYGLRTDWRPITSFAEQMVWKSTDESK